MRFAETPAQYRILVVDDEANMRNLLRIHLKRHGYGITETASGEEALRLLREEKYDLIILDIMMPGIDGWEVCSTIRETMNIPILMLTARSDTQDLVSGFNHGADDYLVKPFIPAELIARIGALLRRTHQFNMAESKEEQLQIRFPNLEINVDSHEVSINGTLIDFTPKEFELLHLLAASPQRAYSRDLILDKLWSIDFVGDSRSVDNHVKNIRDKSDRAGLGYDPIQTVWGVGYKFNLKGTPI
ncbi:response regulator transcription factor [Paenibacillus sp. ACRRX]|uniref:response regulator transcription factor n=1 Tax=unclassified Paenibacillus TaxID=185978 RepID=UPI001EF5F3A1|nr:MULTISPECIES: response regulator transcription factor [unclassified Paenibacillus]MCG7407346.1 response regulator transcription factor [Paenibacillus sp. ACRRX]MDK8180572.1 response regulator transcription factor [Paenibacillus sp. UMB4589-SE434]